MKNSLMRLGRWVFWLAMGVLAVVGVVLAAIIFCFAPLSTQERLDADAHQGEIWTRDPGAGGNASVWVYTPDVAPGDRIFLEVGVYRESLAVAVSEVKGTFRGTPIQKQGPGGVWGLFLSTKGMGVKRGFFQFDLTVPANAQPGEVLEIQMEVVCDVAVPSGDKYRTEKATVPITVPVTVRSPEEAARRRATTAASAIGYFVLVCVLVTWFQRALRGGVLREDRADRAIAAILIPAPLGYGWLGYIGFARPLIGAMGLPWSLVGNALVVLWLAAPVLSLVLFKPRDRSAPPAATSRRKPDFADTGLPKA